MISRIIQKLNPAHTITNLARPSITRLSTSLLGSRSSLANTSIHNPPAAFLSTAAKIEPTRTITSLARLPITRLSTSLLGSRLSLTNTAIYNPPAAFLSTAAKIESSSIKSTHKVADVKNELKSSDDTYPRDLGIINTAIMHDNNLDKLHALVATTAANSPQVAHFYVALSLNVACRHLDYLHHNLNSELNRHRRETSVQDIVNARSKLKDLIDANKNSDLSILPGTADMTHPEALLFYLENGGKTNSLSSNCLYLSLSAGNELSLLKQYLTHPGFEHRAINFMLYHFVREHELNLSDRIEAIELLLKAGANPKEDEQYLWPYVEKKITILESYLGQFRRKDPDEVIHKIYHLLRNANPSNTEAMEIESVTLNGSAAAYFKPSADGKKDQPQPTPTATLGKSRAI